MGKIEDSKGDCLMSYICKDCGEVFAEPEHILTRYYPEPVYEITVCPYCGSSGYEKACTCSMCEADIPESQDAFHLCKACEAQAAKKFQDHLNTYTQDELDFLSWKWEGEAFERKGE